MRKSHEILVRSWLAGTPWKSKLDPDGARHLETDGKTIWYRGNAIATKVETHGGIRLGATMAGWYTPTTRAILNSVGVITVGGSICGQRKGDHLWFGAMSEQEQDGTNWKVFGYLPYMHNGAPESYKEDWYTGNAWKLNKLKGGE
jgi:hypothetical protein